MMFALFSCTMNIAGPMYVADFQPVVPFQSGMYSRVLCFPFFLPPILFLKVTLRAYEIFSKNRHKNVMKRVSRKNAFFCQTLGN